MSKKNRKSLIMYTLALFSTAVFIIVISYLYNMRVELEKELSSVRTELNATKLELEEAYRMYDELYQIMEE